MQYRELARTLPMQELTDAARAFAELKERQGLDPDHYAGHSLRAGFLISAAENGANLFKLMEVSRHKSCR